ncbi:hypothetical protein Tco_0757020 [Tanacetum coccineum]
MSKKTNEDRGKDIELQNSFEQLASQHTSETVMGESSDNGTKLKNLFEKLNEITTIVDPNSDDAILKKSVIQDNSYDDETDSEVEEIIVEDSPKKISTKGASTPIEDVPNV